LGTPFLLQVSLFIKHKTYKLAILFVLQKIKINKKGHCPKKCRIKFKKRRKEFSIGIFINSDYLDSGKQKALPPNIEKPFLNNKLSGIRSR
jgi:hypothetical protein